MSKRREIRQLLSCWKIGLTEKLNHWAAESPVKKCLYVWGICLLWACYCFYLVIGLFIN